MKKYIFMFSLLSTFSYGTEFLGLPSPVLEEGVSGIRVSSNYRVINLNKSIADPIKDIYKISGNNNELLFDSVSKNTSSDFLIDVNVGYLRRETLKSPNTSLVLGYSLDEDNMIGLGFNYNNFKGRYSGIKSKGDGYQLNLFYKNQEDLETLTTILYAGTLDERLNNTREKLDNTYWGLHARYEVLEESYNELFKGYRIDIDGKQLRQKQENQKRTNDSIKAGLKGIVKKEIEIKDNQKISFEILSGYEREFMDTRVYKKIMKDDFKDSVGIEAKVGYKFEEKIVGYVSVEGKKSLNTSNTETIVNIGIKYNF